MIQMRSTLDHEQPNEAEENLTQKAGGKKNRTQKNMLKQLYHLYIMIVTDRDITIKKRRLHMIKARDCSKPICICQ